MRPSPEAICETILESAQEWGLCPQRNKRDSDFCEEAIEAAIASLRPSATLEEDWQALYVSLRDSALPSDLDVAIRFVLEALLEDSQDEVFVHVTDAIDMHFAPFYRDKRTRQTSYRLRREYHNFAKADLNPFQRFSGREMDAAEWYHHLWRNMEGSLDGIVFKVMVAHYLENHMACANCNSRNSLRWNRRLGTLSSWTDVVCIKCRATYETKSLANLDRVETRLKCNKIRFGAFERFYKYHPSGRRYLLLVSREPTEGWGQNQLTHRVAIGEIRKMLPWLKDESFIRGKSFWLVGEVELKRETVIKNWCSVPAICQSDFFEIAEEVYINNYGPEKWNRNSNAITLTVSSTASKNADILESDSVKRQKEEEEKKSLESLAALRLGGADASGGNWEDLKYGNDEADIFESCHVKWQKDKEETVQSLSALRMGGDASGGDWEDLNYGHGK